MKIRCFSCLICVFLFLFSYLAEIQAEKSVYTIKYDDNGKECYIPHEQTKISGEMIEVADLAYIEHFGYTCIGWSTNPKATEAEYTRYDRYKKDESTTLYAIWQEPFDLGEINESQTWKYKRPYDYCDMWFQFTVKESGWYYFETLSEFNHFTNSGAAIYINNFKDQAIAVSEKKGKEFTITARLKSGVCYYLECRANSKDLVLNVQKVNFATTNNATDESDTSNEYNVSKEEIGVIQILQGKNPTIRSIASTKGDKLGTAESGKKYDLLEKTDKWYKIRLDDGKEGWITSKMAKIIE